MTTDHRHLVALNLPCSVAGTLDTLVQYHVRLGSGLTTHDIVVEALARGLSSLLLEARPGPRQLLAAPDPMDITVQ